MRSRITAALRSGSATRSRCGSTRCPAAAAGGSRAAELPLAGFQKLFEGYIHHSDRRGIGAREDTNGITEKAVASRIADQPAGADGRLVLHRPRGGGAVPEQAHRLHQL